jgi:hypothetical protein
LSSLVAFISGGSSPSALQPLMVVPQETVGDVHIVGVTGGAGHLPDHDRWSILAELQVTDSGTHRALQLAGRCSSVEHLIQQWPMSTHFTASMSMESP